MPRLFCPAKAAQHNTALTQTCTGWHTCPLTALLCVAVPTHRQPAPLCGACVLFISSTPSVNKDNFRSLCLWGLCFRKRESHTYKYKWETECLQGWALNHSPGNGCNDSTWLKKNYSLWTGCRDSIQKGILYFGPQQFFLTEACTITATGRRRRFLLRNPQRCSVLAGQLLLFFFDLSSMHLLFPTHAIKHFPLTLCRALLKKSLV